MDRHNLTLTPESVATEGGGQWTKAGTPLTPAQEETLKFEVLKLEALRARGANPFIPEDRELVSDISQNINDDDYTFFGLRIDEDRVLAVGSVVPNSRVYVDGELTGDLLRGTSVVPVWDTEKPHYENKEAVVARALSRLRPYFGSVLTLVSGYSRSYGEDKHEWVLEKAKVVKTWNAVKHATKDYSPTQGATMVANRITLGAARSSYKGSRSQAARNAGSAAGDRASFSRPVSQTGSTLLLR